MTKPTNNPAPHAGEKEIKTPKDGQTPGMAQPPSEVEDNPSGNQPPDQRASAPTYSKTGNSDRPSFSSTADDPLATAGTGGSEDPKGKVRPGRAQVPAESPDKAEGGTS